MRSVCSKIIVGGSRTLYGFDSFEGFPEPSAEDEPSRFPGIIEKGHYSTSREAVITHLVKSGIRQDFVDARVRLVKGFFETTLKTYQGGPIALLHLDVDLYKSYLQCLTQLYPLVAPGGVIAFDEYQSDDKYVGCRKAVDEYLAGRETILKSAVMDRYYLIKRAV